MPSTPPSLRTSASTSSLPTHGYKEDIATRSPSSQSCSPHFVASSHSNSLNSRAPTLHPSQEQSLSEPESLSVDVQGLRLFESRSNSNFDLNLKSNERHFARPSPKQQRSENQLSSANTFDGVGVHSDQATIEQHIPGVRTPRLDNRLRRFKTFRMSSSPQNDDSQDSGNALEGRGESAPASSVSPRPSPRIVAAEAAAQRDQINQLARVKAEAARKRATKSSEGGKEPLSLAATSSSRAPVSSANLGQLLSSPVPLISEALKPPILGQASNTTNESSVSSNAPDPTRLGRTETAPDVTAPESVSPEVQPTDNSKTKSAGSAPTDLPPQDQGTSENRQPQDQPIEQIPPSEPVQGNVTRGHSIARSAEKFKKTDSELSPPKTAVKTSFLTLPRSECDQEKENLRKDLESAHDVEVNKLKDIHKTTLKQEREKLSHQISNLTAQTLDEFNHLNARHIQELTALENQKRDAKRDWEAERRSLLSEKAAAESGLQDLRAENERQTQELEQIRRSRQDSEEQSRVVLDRYEDLTRTTDATMINAEKDKSLLHDEIEDLKLIAEDARKNLEEARRKAAMPSQTSLQSYEDLEETAAEQGNKIDDLSQKLADERRKVTQNGNELQEAQARINSLERDQILLRQQVSRIPLLQSQIVHKNRALTAQKKSLADTILGIEAEQHKTGHRIKEVRETDPDKIAEEAEKISANAAAQNDPSEDGSSALSDDLSSDVSGLLDHGDIEDDQRSDSSGGTARGKIDMFGETPTNNLGQEPSDNEYQAMRDFLQAHPSVLFTSEHQFQIAKQLFSMNLAGIIERGVGPVQDEMAGLGGTVGRLFEAGRLLGTAEQLMEARKVVQLTPATEETGDLQRVRTKPVLPGSQTPLQRLLDTLTLESVAFHTIISLLIYWLLDALLTRRPSSIYGQLSYSVFGWYLDPIPQQVAHLMRFLAPEGSFLTG
ncbi:MAG: hypothetical protein M1814_001545 [Vezdaea aestivalis]|nr:MAG: hypothetical protein M1814_001545 [Vezdaea aestivalis]